MLRLKAEEIKKQFQKGLDYRDKGNYKKAIKIFNKVLNNDPKFIKAWEVLGLAYLKTKTHFKSIEAFNQAIQLEPDNEKYHIYKATAYQEIGNKNETIKCAETALSLNPSSQVARMIKESAQEVPLESSTMGKMISKTVNKLVEEAVNQPEIKESMGQLIEKYKHLSPHVQQLLELINSLGDSYQTGRLLNMYISAINSREISQQVNFFEELVKFFPMSEFAWGLLGETHMMKTKNFSKAIECFEKYIEIKPCDFKGWYSLGGVYGMMNDFNSAIESFRKSLELEPKHLLTLTNLSLAYELNGDIENALFYIKQYIDLEPNDPNALIKLNRMNLMRHE